MVFALTNDAAFSARYRGGLYYFHFAATAVFMTNQIKCELTQLQNEASYADYFLDFWNFNDFIYLGLNFLVLLSNLTGACGIELQRTMAATSACFLWIKMLDWLRLFPTTAFYMSLVKETILDISSFLIIMAVWYLLFGTAFYLLSYNRQDDHAVIRDISPVWIIDAFQTEYELSLGEFQGGLESIDASAGDNLFLCYLFFGLASFFITIIFLNMMIAIMADTFAKVTENKDNRERITRLEIMGDYVDLID